MLTIVMPMAGRGKRFQDEGYALPKPLIPVHGKPMVEVVLDNLRPSQPHQFVFVLLEEHVREHRIDAFVKELEPSCKIVVVDGVTEGAACTVLLAREWIDTDAPLMVANCDQWIDIDINDYLAAMDREEADGLIMTMWADHPKWSYVRFGEDGRIVEVVEKQVVSNEATVGIYNYRRGQDFVEAADRMIGKNLRVNNEFYVAPAYNEMIADGKKIIIHNVGREYAGMYGLGIPSDLKQFESLAVSRKAVHEG